MQPALESGQPTSPTGVPSRASPSLMPQECIALFSLKEPALPAVDGMHEGLMDGSWGSRDRHDHQMFGTPEV